MMKINKLQTFSIIFICIFCVNFASAQDTSKTNIEAKVVSLSKVKAYLVGFGFEREQKISALKTIYFGASIESIVPFFPKNPGGSDALRFEYSINVAPVLNLGYRKYTNFNEREKARKTTLNNSGSFIGLEFSLIAPILINKRYTTNYTSSLSPIWGFQKSISKNSNLELSAGPSIQSDFNDYRLSGFVKFGINFLL